VDFGMKYNFDTSYGNFSLSANAAKLETAFQDPSPEAQSLLAAIADGTIDGSVDVPGSESFIQVNGRPKWRGNASLRWDEGNWGAGAFYSYVGEVIDTSVTGPNGEEFVVDNFQTVSVYGDYTFEEWLGGDTRVRLGIRNIGDEQAPVADQFARGYFTTLHSNRGRYFYLDLRKEF
jgi:hypothetical protein